MNRALVRALPELGRRYAEETAAWGKEMGPHVMYADLLNPLLADLLRRDDHANLRRVLDVLEKLLAHPDPAYGEVVRTAVAEDLEGRPELLVRARPHMGPLMAEATRSRAGVRQPRRLRRT
jgi:hypothetical protein